MAMEVMVGGRKNKRDMSFYKPSGNFKRFVAEILNKRKKKNVKRSNIQRFSQRNES